MALRDVIVIGCIIASVPVCFCRPVFGILMWVVMSFLNPQDYAWGSAREISLAVLVAVPTLAGFVVFSRSWRWLFCREGILLLTLWLWFTATTVNSVHDPILVEKAADAWYRWNMVSKILLMTGVTMAVINTWDKLRWLALSIAGSFGFLALKSIPRMILSDGASRVYGPPNSMIADNNDFGLAMNMALPFFFCLATVETDRRIRRIMALIFLVAIPTIFLTYSRGALLGLIVVGLAMVLQSRQRGVLISMVALAGLFAFAFAPQQWRDRMNASNGLDASARSRLNSWAYARALVKDYPTMGGGFEAFTPSLFAKYAPDPRDVHGPHSIYFGVLLEHGYIGLGLYLLLVGSCLVSLTNLARHAKRYGDVRSLQYANMLRFSLLGFLTSGAFLGRAYFDFFFTIVAATAILRKLFREQWSEADDSTADDTEGTELETENAASGRWADITHGGMKFGGLQTGSES